MLALKHLFASLKTFFFLKSLSCFMVMTCFLPSTVIHSPTNNLIMAGNFRSKCRIPYFEPGSQGHMRKQEVMAGLAWPPLSPPPARSPPDCSSSSWWKLSVKPIMLSLLPARLDPCLGVNFQTCIRHQHQTSEIDSSTQPLFYSSSSSVPRRQCCSLHIFMKWFT